MATSGFDDDIDDLSCSGEDDANQYPVIRLNDDSLTTIQHANSKPDDESDETDVVMSILWQQGKLGIGFYDVDSAILYVTSDYCETPDFLVTRTLLRQICPSVVVTMAKSDIRFLKLLNEWSNRASNYNEESVSEVAAGPGYGTVASESGLVESLEHSVGFLPFRLEIVSKQDFGVKVAKQRLSLINIPSMPTNMTESDRQLYFSSIFPMESINSFRAVGSLLKYLNDKRVAIELEANEATTPIVAIRHFTFDRVMLLNRDVYYGLQIFSPLSHPSVYKAAFKNSGKEGLSLRLLFQNSCKSSLGRKRMSLWLLRPLQDLEVINDRLNAVQFFVNPKNFEVVHGLQTAIKRLRDISRILIKMVHVPLSIAEWKTLKSIINSCCEIVNICKRYEKRLIVFARVLSLGGEDEVTNSTHLTQLYEALGLINHVIDFEQSAIENRAVVKKDIDADLDEKRRIYYSLKSIMDSVAEIESADLVDVIPSELATLVYEPQMGFFLTVPASEPFFTEELYLKHPLDYRFTADDLAHFKTPRTIELDNRYGDIYSDMKDRENEILLNLQSAVLKTTDTLLHILEGASILDCLLAFATVAGQNHYRRPTVNNTIDIDIVNGRHPLLEQLSPNFIPNDTLMSEKRVSVITGPNSSGKSVYLKQVALIVYMAHLGSFVPAEKATIGLTDKIFSRLKTYDCISEGLSAFAVDVNQVIPAVHHATKRSLVVLDEYGKGTLESNGIGTLVSTINYWLRKVDDCPRLIVCTHFLEIINLKVIIQSNLVNFLTTQISTTGDNKIVFLFKIIPGNANSSEAARIALQGGMMETLIARAKEVTEHFTAMKPIPGRPISEEDLEKAQQVIDKFSRFRFDAADDVIAFLRILDA